MSFEKLLVLKVKTIETRRLRGDQILVFKILFGYENIDRIFFSTKKDCRTRGHEETLVKGRVSVDWISESTHSHRG